MTFGCQSGEFSTGQIPHCSSSTCTNNKDHVSLPRPVSASPLSSCPDLAWMLSAFHPCLHLLKSIALLRATRTGSGSLLLLAGEVLDCKTSLPFPTLLQSGLPKRRSEPQRLVEEAPDCKTSLLFSTLLPRELPKRRSELLLLVEVAPDCKTSLPFPALLQSELSKRRSSCNSAAALRPTNLAVPSKTQFSLLKSMNIVLLSNSQSLVKPPFAHPNNPRSLRPLKINSQRRT